MATPGNPGTRALGALLGAVGQGAGSPKGRGAANTVWAVAAPGHPGTGALGALLGAAKQKAGGPKAQKTPETVWAWRHSATQARGRWVRCWVR